MKSLSPKQKEALQKFAISVLYLAESFSEWNAEWGDLIAESARFSGLATESENGWFHVAEDLREAAGLPKENLQELAESEDDSD
jgi:hypothetical protein